MFFHCSICGKRTNWSHHVFMMFRFNSAQGSPITNDLWKMLKKKRWLSYCSCFRNPANHLGCIKPCKYLNWLVSRVQNFSHLSTVWFSGSSYLVGGFNPFEEYWSFFPPPNSQSRCCAATLSPSGNISQIGSFPQGSGRIGVKIKDLKFHYLVLFIRILSPWLPGSSSSSSSSSSTNWSNFFSSCQNDRWAG